MQRGLTWILVLVAGGLFCGIYFFERKLPSSAELREPKRLLPMATANQINAVQVTFPGQGEVRAEKSGGQWELTRPPYSARQITLETFATNLLELRVIDRVPPHEVLLQGEKSYGLQPPRAVVEVSLPSDKFRFEVGGIAPITSNVYLRLPGSGEIVLANSDLLAALPRSTNDWRSLGLVDLPAASFDRVEIRAGQRSFELAHNPTNGNWQISKPVPARADQERVLELLRILRSAQASAFVSDSPGEDLERFGLQSPRVEVRFSNGTNRLYDFALGSVPASATNQVFARLEGRGNVVLAPRQLVAYLSQPYSSFHDPRLVTLDPAALDRVAVHARENFTLQRKSQGGWVLDDKEKTPVDLEALVRLVNNVVSFEILKIEKEVPSDADLKALGFIPPTASYAFFEKMTNSAGSTTNIHYTELTFGGAQRDKVFVRRSDETPVYLTQLPEMLALPKRAFELRDRTIWQFPPTNVVSLSLSEGGATNTITRTASGWSDDAIANARLDELVFRLSNLRAREWVEQGRARLGTFGLKDDPLTLSIEVRRPSGNTEERQLRFGRQTLQHDIYTAVEFADASEPTIFELPGELYQMLLQSVPVPH